ncbi:MAG: phage integrase SAM-like domain and Arm DNA-binding domain-containing protein, partial [Bacteroidetes bacterium]|nr:phage integrase SAM-like domain and Arm DNA-binding domain-containing protein [Bacteroidota bacterium]
MAIFKAILQTWKGKGDEPRLILFCIQHDNERRYISLSEKAKPSQWNKKNRCARASHPESTRINAKIQNLLSDGSNARMRMDVLRVPVTAEGLKKVLTPGVDTSNFWNWADSWLAAKYESGQIYYWRRCKSVLRKFKEMTGPELPWTDLTAARLREFDLYQKGIGNSANTRGGSFRVLKTIIKDAIREDVITPADDPFHRFEPPRSEQTKKAVLS